MLIEAAIDKDRIRVSGPAGSATKQLAVTLVHPSTAPAAAPRAAGVALLSEPGPAPPELVAELIARLAASGSPLPWQTLVPTPRGAPEGSNPGRSGVEPSQAAAIRETLIAVGHRIQTAELDRARALLKDLPATIDDDGLALEVATVWVRLGEQAKAAKLLERPFAGPTAVVAGVIRGSVTRADTVLANVPTEAVCRYVHVAQVFRELGHHGESRQMARLIRQRDSTCARAWEHEIHALLELEDLNAALEVSKNALKWVSGDESLLSTVGAVHHARGEFYQAATIFLDVARRHKTKPGRLAPLLSVIVRDKARRQQWLGKLAADHEADPEDRVSQFLLGVLHHYMDHYDESNRLLKPLDDEGLLAHEDRLAIYLAMNAFNQGDTEGALVRLNRAAQDPAPDPDVYYCRAEILRDTDRAQALADLRRYLAMSDGQSYSNDSKQARVKKMEADLVRCLETGVAKCESEWEHPRALAGGGGHRVDLGVWLAGGAALLALLGGVFWFVRSRRRRRRQL